MSATVRHALMGCAIGFGFVVGGTVIAIASAGLPFAVASMLRVQFDVPLLWVVDTAPAVLAAFGAIAGRRQDRVDRLAAQLADAHEATREQLSRTKFRLDETGMHNVALDFRSRKMDALWSIVRATIPALQFGGTRAVEDSIHHALRSLCKASRAGRAYLFRVDLDRGVMDNTHEWCSDSVEPHIEDLRDVPLTTFPWILGILKRGEVVDVSSVAVIPTVSNERESIEAQGIRALLIVPVRIGDRLIGFAGLDDTVVERPWDRELVDALGIVGTVALAALDRNGRLAARTA